MIELGALIRLTAVEGGAPCAVRKVVPCSTDEVARQVESDHRASHVLIRLPEAAGWRGDPMDPPVRSNMDPGVMAGAEIRAGVLEVAGLHGGHGKVHVIMGTV